MESLKDFGLSPVSALPHLSTHATVELSTGHTTTTTTTKSSRRGINEDTISATSSESEASDDDDADMSIMEVDNEDDGDDHDPSFTESDRYLVPIEVEAQLRLLWLQNQEVLDFIWLRALHTDDNAHKVQQAFIRAQYLKRSSSQAKNILSESEGWRMFFTRVVLVPANKFRPPGKVGDMVAEHPQNTHLKKVMIENNTIRDLYRGTSSTDTEEEEGGSSGKSRNKNRQSLSALISQPDTTSSIDNSNEGVNLSKVVSHWIDLQQAVNCYMDSAKDGNVLAQAGPAGIRQILERKEGLFRRHMMGKRVNFCCRSVISPDPYLGTNEIGIPVHFAKNLHYPTPVNSWNVKYLRTLVERGPFQYPGRNTILCE